MSRYLTYVLAGVMAIAAAHAGTLTTTFSASASQDGNMFDLRVTSAVPLLVTGLALNLADNFQGTIEIYSRTGSFIGFQSNPGAWTLLDSLNVTSAGVNTPTLINPAGFLLAANATTALYITDTSGFHMQYTTGGTMGSVAASNADLQILEGIGVQYPFGAAFTPRTWNGTIFYQRDPSAVPEPSSMALLAIGGLGLLWKVPRAA